MYPRVVRYVLLMAASLALVACETKVKPQSEPPADKGAKPPVDKSGQPPVDMAASAKAAEILDTAIAAYGGLENLKKVEAWTASSTGVYMGMPFEATSTYHKGEIRMDITMHDGEHKAMVQGERNCWTRTGLVVTSCPEQERRANRELSTYEQAMQLWPLKEGGWKLVGSETSIDDKPYPSLTISKPGLDGEGKLVFHPETNLIVQAVFPGEMHGRKNTFSVGLSHYHKDCGIMMARETKTTFGGLEFIDENFAGFHCGPVDPNLFIEPLQVASGTTQEKTAGASTLACRVVKGEYTQIGAVMPELMNFVGKKRFTPVGSPIMVYVKASPEVKTPAEYVTEVCIPVSAKPPDKPLMEGDFMIKGMAPIKVLAMYGIGDYSKKSGELAGLLMEELAKRKLKAAGALRQVTHHNPNLIPVEKLVSEMQVPIK